MKSSKKGLAVTKNKKTKHFVAKNRSGHWGTREEAKTQSKKVRRTNSKRSITADLSEFHEDIRPKIRQANLSDMPGIQILLKDLGYPISDLVTFQKIYRAILNSSDQGIFVARDEEVVIAFLSYSAKPQLRLLGASIEIDELVVGRQARGKGADSLLLAAIKKEARKIKAKRITLSTNRERESYQRGFYEKNGFVEKIRHGWS